MANDLQTGFYFTILITGESGGTDAAFQEVSGLSKELGIEEVVCGGENRFKYRLPTRTTYPNLVLKRGIILTDSPLIEWCKNTLDSGLSEPIITKNISVNLLNANGETSMSWNFIKAYPIKWATSELRSQESSLLIETIEFAYQYFKLEADDRVNTYAGVASLYGD